MPGPVIWNDNPRSPMHGSNWAVDYRDWSAWPEEDVRQYARELATFHSLNPSEASHLEHHMAREAGPFSRKVFGPFRMSGYDRAVLWEFHQFDAERARLVGRAATKSFDEREFEENARLNRPFRPWRDTGVVEEKVVGSGLTAYRVRHYSNPAARTKRERHRAHRYRGAHPFTTVNSKVRMVADKALWHANCLPIGHGRWLVRPADCAPRSGAWWYSSQLERVYANARKQADLGNVEAALLHAFNAGRLFQELEMRLAHNAFFEKQQAIVEAQRSSPESRRKHTDEERRERVRHHMRNGDKPTIAAENAARDLEVSLTTIRKAFPGGLLPRSADF